LVVAGLVGAKVALAQLQAGRDALQVRRLQRWGGALVAVLVVLNLLVIDLKYARTYAWNVDNINDMHVEMGKWLQQNTAADAVIATHDVGAIGYFSQRRLLDTAGLVTPGVLQYLQPGVVADEGVLRYLQREKPDYLVILPNWYPQLAQNTEFFEPIYAITLQNNTIAAGSRMVVYKTKWRQ
jgi:arabinofuranosyltransferase